ncbi:MAG: sulfatase [Gemmatimonadota bacterium]
MSGPGGAETSGRRLRGLGALGLALWFALATGFADVLIQGFRQQVLGHVIHRSVHFWWTIPVAYVGLFAPAGLLLFLLGRRRSGVGVGPAAALLALLGLGSLLTLPPFRGLHAVALGLVAAGGAYRTGVAAHRRAAGFRALVRRALPWMALAVPATALLVTGLETWREARARGSLPPPPGEAPDVLLVILDTVRAQNMSLYGYARATTPLLERRARESVVFDAAFSTSPWTLPSHGTMFTGRYPHELDADWLVPLGAATPTLAEAFAARGYLTAGFVANRSYATYEHGLDRGFAHYEDYRVSPGQILRSAGLGRRLADARSLRPLIGTDDQLGHKDAARLTDDFLAWRRKAGAEGRPLFAFLNYFDAHDPYLPPDEYLRRFDPDRTSGRLSPFRRHAPAVLARRVTRRDIREEMAAYDGAIAYVDAEVGRLLAELERTGDLDRTIVVIASDHGEQFGENGLFFHGNGLYLPTLHVPLLIRYPARVPEGVRVVEPVSLRDLAATIVDLADLGRGPAFPGVSLEARWSPGERGPAGSPVIAEVRKGVRLPAFYPVSKGDMSSILTADGHLIRNGDGREELYDWKTDPREATDLAAGPGGAELRAGLREALRRVEGEAQP